MKIASIIARYLLGLMFTVFGLNGFPHFIHQPPPANPLAIQFLLAVSASHFAAFFFAVQVLAGLLLLSGFWVPLALTLLAAETLQHPCVSPDAFARHRSGARGLCSMGAGLSSASRKLQQHLQREACNAGNPTL